MNDENRVPNEIGKEGDLIHLQNNLGTYFTRKGKNLLMIRGGYSYDANNRLNEYNSLSPREQDTIYLMYSPDPIEKILSLGEDARWSVDDYAYGDEEKLALLYDVVEANNFGTMIQLDSIFESFSDLQIFLNGTQIEKRNEEECKRVNKTLAQYATIGEHGVDLDVDEAIEIYGMSVRLYGEILSEKFTYLIEQMGRHSSKYTQQGLKLPYWLITTSVEEKLIPFFDSLYSIDQKMRDDYVKHFYHYVAEAGLQHLNGQHEIFEDALNRTINGYSALEFGLKAQQYTDVEVTQLKENERITNAYESIDTHIRYEFCELGKLSEFSNEYTSLGQQTIQEAHEAYTHSKKANAKEEFKHGFNQSLQNGTLKGWIDVINKHFKTDAKGGDAYRDQSERNLFTQQIGADRK